MAGTRRTTATRTTTPRRRARRRARRPGRWVAPTLAVAGGLLVAATQVAPAVLEVSTASRAVAVGAQLSVNSPVGTDPFTAAVTSEGLAHAGSAAAQQAETGLVVPQPPRPHRIVVVPNANVGRAPELEHRPDPCGGSTSPRRMAPGVVAGPGSATVSWMSDGRAEVLSYRVSAVSQRLVPGEQAEPVRQVVPAAEGCQEQAVVLAGLAPGVPYVFWLEEETLSPSTGVARLYQVGTSAPVVIG
ncbi:hypothetical protein [Modestobacter sp. SYSU DS0290]